MRNCTICTHDKREEIDVKIVAKTAYRNIAKQYTISTAAICRHKKEHLPKELIKSEETKEIARADNLIGQVQSLKDRADNILDKAEQGKSYTIALQAIKEIRSIVELLAKLSGDIQTGVTIHLSPEWISLRTVIINSLLPYPEAGKAVLEAIKKQEEG